MVEHLVYTERVGGSSPSAPTIKPPVLHQTAVATPKVDRADNRIGEQADRAEDERQRQRYDHSPMSNTKPTRIFDFPASDEEVERKIMRSAEHDVSR